MLVARRRKSRDSAAIHDAPRADDVAQDRRLRTRRILQISPVITRRISNSGDNHPRVGLARPTSERSPSAFQIPPPTLPARPFFHPFPGRSTLALPFARAQPVHYAGRRVMLRHRSTWLSILRHRRSRCRCSCGRHDASLCR